MKHCLTILISLVAILSLSSCGDSRDKLMQDQIDYLNEMAEVTEDVAAGKLSSSEAAEKFSSMKKTGDDFMKRKEALFKEMSTEDGKALIEKYSEASMKAMMRYQKAIRTLQSSGKLTPEMVAAFEKIK